MTTYKSRSSLAHSRAETAKPGAFTLLELLVVLSVVVLVASAIVPSQVGAKPTGRAFQCLANSKQLMLANFMYQSENRDALPTVFHGGFVPTANDSNRPWVTGWLDWLTTSDNTNLLYLIERRYASLSVYLGGSTSIYKCPEDVYVSPGQRAVGWSGRVRSVSANLYVGKGNGWAAVGGGPSGPNNLAIYRGASKASDLAIPGPARTWVYMDEHPDSMNDGGGWPPNTPSNIPDAPATYHNGAAGFAMADGHAEMHRWRGATMNGQWSLRVNMVNRNNFTTIKGDPDLFWYSYSSPRWTTRTAAD